MAYKIRILYFVDPIDEEGLRDGEGYIDDNSPHQEFNSLTEAEDWIKETYDIKDFEYTDANGHDELQSGYEEKGDDGKPYSVMVSISIDKVETEIAQFKELKEVGQ